MDGQEIAVRGQSLWGCVIGCPKRVFGCHGLAAEIVDFHAESPRTLGCGLPDAAHAENAQPFAGNIQPQGLGG